MPNQLWCLVLFSYASRSLFPIRRQNACHHSRAKVKFLLNQAVVTNESRFRGLFFLVTTDLRAMCYGCSS